MQQPVLAVGEVFAQYRLDAPLDASSTTTTEVFRATDVEGGLEVVVEIVKPTATSVEKARFATRARRLAQIRHPSLMTALDVGPTHCAFEAPAGGHLSEHAGVAIARSRQKLFWLAQIAGAIAALHRGGIVHGRLSLEEILVPADLGVKLAIPLGGEITASPLDDVRAFGRLACELLLGIDCTTEAEPRVTTRLTEAGVPPEGAATFARVAVGQSITSEDLAEKLTMFAEYTGPTTEPLLPIVPRRSSPH